jgi:hypothetical protein
VHCEAHSSTLFTVVNTVVLSEPAGKLTPWQACMLFICCVGAVESSPHVRLTGVIEHEADCDGAAEDGQTKTNAVRMIKGTSITQETKGPLP